MAQIAAQSTGRTAGVTAYKVANTGVLWGVTIDPTATDPGGANMYLLPAGTCLVRDDTTQLCRPFRGTATTAAASSAATACAVRNARFLKAGDAITVGGTAATISAVNYTTNTLTLASGITWASGAAVVVSGETVIPNGFLDSDTDVRDPIRRTPVATPSVACAYGGEVFLSKCHGDTAAFKALYGGGFDSKFTDVESLGRRASF